MLWISDVDAARLRTVPHFRDSDEAVGDLSERFGSYVVNFADQISKFDGSAKIRSVADIGCGYGWLAIALSLRTGDTRVVAVEPNADRLAAARRIAKIFGVHNRIEWRVGSLGALPFRDQEIDISCCIEVLEHIGGRIELVRDLARVTRQFLVITTPNKLFPIIRHDTCLPFCHWLPPGIFRDCYAAAFGRRKRQDNNHFWSPAKLLSALPDFERESVFFQFRQFADYCEAQQRLYPGGHRHRRILKSLEQSYYRAARLTGRRSIYFLPNLASTFRRRLRST